MGKVTKKCLAALYFGALFAAMLVGVSCAKKNHKPPPEGVKSGEQQCPCFCSERNDATKVGPYWLDTYGKETSIECGTDSCLDPVLYKDELGLCKDVVDYKFCPRKVNGWNSSSTKSDFVKQLGKDALNCWETTVWEEGTDCDKNVLRGACYVAFPRCKSASNNKVEAKGLCSSFCENERLNCRTLTSAFGPANYIKEVCAAEPYVNAVGPSEECTGAAGRPVSTNLAALCVAAVALVLGIVA